MEKRFDPNYGTVPLYPLCHACCPSLLSSLSPPSIFDTELSGRTVTFVQGVRCRVLICARGSPVWCNIILLDVFLVFWLLHISLCHHFAVFRPWDSNSGRSYFCCDSWHGPTSLTLHTLKQTEPRLIPVSTWMQTPNCQQWAGSLTWKSAACCFLCSG